jgi:hypothetical protein
MALTVREIMQMQAPLIRAVTRIDVLDALAAE